MIPRKIQTLVEKTWFHSGKIVLLLGARQVGKTTLIKSFQFSDALYLNCDLDEHLEIIDTTSLLTIQKTLSDYHTLIIDEAQRLTNPGLTLKIIYDNFPGIKILATGSSSFELKNRLSDTLTGRYLDFILYPISVSEAATSENYKPYLSDLLLYGGYPEIYIQKDNNFKKKLLEKIIESYLFKDILSFSRVRNSLALKNLTRALAYQIGSEINENELANRLKIDRKTVLSYLDILEKSFIIIRLYPYSRNPRREIGRRYKVYFVDLGLRNALIGDFNSLNVRSDSGALWENFLVVERRKKLSFEDRTPTTYFWRDYSGAEIDYVEESPLTAFEFKYSQNNLSRSAHAFKSRYHIPVNLINREKLNKFLF